MKTKVLIMVFLLSIVLAKGWVVITAIEPSRRVVGTFIEVSGKAVYRGSFTWADRVYVTAKITVGGKDSGMYTSSSSEEKGTILGNSFNENIGVSVMTFYPHGLWCTQACLKCVWYGSGPYPNFLTKTTYTTDIWSVTESDSDRACVTW